MGAGSERAAESVEVLEGRYSHVLLDMSYSLTESLFRPELQGMRDQSGFGIGSTIGWLSPSFI